ncbi:MAG: glycoside hydrolase 43 family protein [candidate division KSB1 bacterium]|nr:glycoside hydrolase 43 family protein [candidate division KSB1 bacterium]
MTSKFVVLMLLILMFSCAHEPAYKTHSDNGDGTYTNPVIPADFPDPDVIRVDDTYYFVSTTMFIFPGVTVLKSQDLVNWEYCSHAVQRFDYSPCYNLDGCNRYGHGQWATSLRYHQGKFYLLFITLDEGGFVCTADRAEGPWAIRKLPRGFYDPGLFFDDDGKIYVAHGYNDIYITEIDSNFVAKDKDVLVYSGDIRKGLEGAHVYKINGYYYLYCTYGGLDGFQVALRSQDIYGPYEQKVVIRDTTHGPNYGIHQGALVQTQTGEWWTMLFADSGPFGRFPSLQPVTWEEGWPMVGVDGKAVVTCRKPDVGREYPATTLPTSDEFDNSELGLQWGWNHNPDSTKWSLTEHPGHLRLETVRVADSLPVARNTLTQRMFAWYSDSVATVGTVKMNFEHMMDGDMAGLAVFQNPYAYVGIYKQDGRHSAVMVNNGKLVESVPIETSCIYLRTEPVHGSGAALYYGGDTVPGTGTARFYYSLDNKTFTQIGNVLHMQFNLSVFTGNKFCLFHFPKIQPGGYVDFDWFRMQPRLFSNLDKE